MKKIIVILAMIMIMTILCFCSCSTDDSGIKINYDYFDTEYNFKYAIVQRYDGEQIIELKSWRDFSDGDQIQITSTDDITYLLHSSQVILLSDLEK